MVNKQPSKMLYKKDVFKSLQKSIWKKAAIVDIRL